MILYLLLQEDMTPKEKEFDNEVKHKMGGGPVPITADQLPTMAKLLTSVPRSVFIFYVSLSSFMTFCVCALLYQGFLKPQIIATYRKKK